MDKATSLVVAVTAIGLLHTIVPDHWAPIALLARQRGWSWRQTARAAALAGTGHTISTLAIAVLVWTAGAALALRFGHAVSALSSLGLVAFGALVALRSWREISNTHGSHRHSSFGCAHAHQRSDGTEHRHWRQQHEAWHGLEGDFDAIPPHQHARETSSRTWLPLILGSSPMVEGIPAFFAASRYGAGLLMIMAIVFAASTIATYVTLCIASAGGLRRLRLGRFETYGEVISGSFVALLGLVFLIVPSL